MQKSTQFPEVALKTWPYLRPMSFRSRTELEDFARQQSLLAGESQQHFHERLHKLRADGGSIRSYPTPQLVPREESIIDVGMLQAMARGVQRQDAKGSSASASPTNSVDSGAAPELDHNFAMDGMYAGVEIEPECDNSISNGPEGEAAQPLNVDWSDAFTGEITLYGKYPYLFKNENKGKQPSYVIRLGTKDVWGVDLERVVREFNLRKGDRIALKCIGEMVVPIEEPGRDDNGNDAIIIRSAKRKTWVAKRIG